MKKRPKGKVSRFSVVCPQPCLNAKRKHDFYSHEKTQKYPARRSRNQIENEKWKKFHFIVSYCGLLWQNSLSI